MGGVVAKINPLRLFRMNKQKGFGLIVYAVLALGILGALGGIGYSVRKAGADSVRAELQPKLDAANASIKAQNAALDALKAAGEAKAAAAAKALQKASERAKTWEQQASRLTAVLTNRKPDAPQDCKAAWAEIRK